MEFKYDDLNRLILPLQSYHLTCAFLEALGYQPDTMLVGDKGVNNSLISLTSPQTIVQLHTLVEQYHPYFEHWLKAGNKCIYNDVLHNFVLAHNEATTKASKAGSGVNWNETLTKTFELMVELVQHDDLIKVSFDCGGEQ